MKQTDKVLEQPLDQWYYVKKDVPLEILQTKKTQKAKQKIANVIARQFAKGLVDILFTHYTEIPPITLRVSKNIFNFYLLVSADMRQELREKLPEKELLWQMYIKTKSELERERRINQELLSHISDVL